MKNYEEMSNSVLKRIETYKTHKNIKVRKNIRVAFLASSLCIVVLAGFFAFGKGPASQTNNYDYLLDYSYTYTPELAARIKELKEQGDKIAWVYYDNSIYFQLQGLEEKYIESLALGKRLGRADKFTGAYENNAFELSGEVYTVAGNDELLVIKLNNGGTVVLKEE